MALKKWQEILITAILGGLITGILAPIIVNHIQNRGKINKEIKDHEVSKVNCSKELSEIWDSQIDVLEQAKKDEKEGGDKIESTRGIVKGCTTLIEKGEGDAEVFMDRGRARIVLEVARKAQASANNIEESLPAELNGAFKDFETASGLASSSPKASFYSSYVKDFEELVWPEIKEGRTDRPKGKIRDCPFVHEGKKRDNGRYSKAIREYLSEHEEELEKFNATNQKLGEYAAVRSKNDLSEEDAYIMIELGHWLNNRDRNMDEAIKLYQIVLAYYGDAGNDVTHNALASIGVAYFSKQKIEVAKRYFNDALDIKKSSELYNNLGAAEALSSNQSYRKAAERYKAAAKAADADRDKKEKKKKKYKSLRSQAYSLLLSGILLNEPQKYVTEAKKDYNEAYSILKDLLNGYEDEREGDELFDIAFGMAAYHKAMINNEDDSTKERLIAEARKYFANKGDTSVKEIADEYIQLIDGKIAKIDKKNSPIPVRKFFANPIPHDIGHDVVLNIGHKLFYCEAEDRRI